MKKLMFLVFVAVLAGSIISCAKKQVVKEEIEDFQAEAAEPDIRGREYHSVDDLLAVNFDYDKSDLRSDTRTILKANAEFLKENADLEVLVEGHCDERGTLEYNMALGQRRAAAVRNYYVKLGISADRISTISYGEEKPVDNRSNETAWAKNRRAESLVRSK